MPEFVLPQLDYALDSLAPAMSQETMEYHYGKHHQAYISNLNTLVKGSLFEGKSLKQIVKMAQGAIFDNAAQAFNHSFFWKSIKPNGGGEPDAKLMAAICARWGSFEGFKKAFMGASLARLGSGWVWLVYKSTGALEIVTTSNAGTPLTEHMRPLLVLDVWEHAYYLDHRNARAKYVETFLTSLVNWDFANRRFGGDTSGCDCYPQ